METKTSLNQENPPIANVLLGAVNNLKLVGSNKGFNVYFNANDQTYTVFKDGKFVIGNKYRFTDVKCYLD